jgi:hypothetical protein
MGPFERGRGRPPELTAFLVRLRGRSPLSLDGRTGLA